jgi:exodeoxyribonuclease V beta subunit
VEGDKPTPVKASDITVLVRSRQEAALIRDALTLLNIPSVYLSNRDSVFETLEAQEMLWLLQAVLARSGKVRCVARWRARCSG